MSVTLTEIRKLRVVDLRARLSELGLPTNGLKADLVDRLYSFYQQQHIEEQQHEDQYAEPPNIIPPHGLHHQALHQPPSPSRPQASMDFSQAQNEPPNFSPPPIMPQQQMGMPSLAPIPPPPVPFQPVEPLDMVMDCPPMAPPQPPQPPLMLLQSGQVPVPMQDQPPRMPLPPPPAPPAPQSQMLELPQMEPPSLPMQLPVLSGLPPPPMPPPQMSLAQIPPPPVLPVEPSSLLSQSPPPMPMTDAEMMEIRQVQEREKQEREAAEAAEVDRIAQEQQELIEREKQRILQQQQERIRQRQEREQEMMRQRQEQQQEMMRQRQEQQRLEEEKMQKAIQQQQMLEEQRKARELDEETRQKVAQQQMLIEHQRVVEETMKEADLLRDQQRALAVQREEEEKIRQQQELIQREVDQQSQRGQQHGNMGGLLPTPPSGGPPSQPLIQGDMQRPPPSQSQPVDQPIPPPGIRGPRPDFPPRSGPMFQDQRGPPERRRPLPDSRQDMQRSMGRGQFDRMPPPHMMDKRPPPRMMDSGPQPFDDEDEAKDIKLPQAMEKILAFKDKRAQQIGSEEAGEAVQEDFFPSTEQYNIPDEDADNEEEDEDEDEEREVEEGDEEPVKKTQSNNQKMSKNQRRKLKKKKRKAAKRLEQSKVDEEGKQKEQKMPDRKNEEKVELEYVPETIEVTDPAFRQFQRIFQAFQLSEPPKPEVKTQEKEDAANADKQKEKEKDEDDVDSDEDSDTEEEDPDKPKISKKKLRKLNRLSVAELKQLVTRPDVVEMHDVTARDPKLLVYLKAYRNTVPVPRHWCFKRKYLQGKRGIIKPPFELPEFIQRTGIMEMRQALQEKEEQQTMKTKMRQKVRPKMGKIDIDYQKLHDAFFRWQTKPKLTIHGDLYYEGKEFETKLKEKKPGELTEELRTALGMPTGSNADKYPPPWLIAMQRYGPPPSYPHLKIAGLNAPIPEGCSFGYHAGGWGKPPVDQSGKPLYGNVFGTGADDLPEEEEEEVDTTRWGELESESEESSSEEESEEEREAGEIDETGLITPADGGLITPSGLTSIPTGMETPDMIELRKKKIEDAMEQGTETPQLYQVIQEKKTNVGAAMVGSTHVYDMPPAGVMKKQVGAAPEGVAIALDPSELDLDTEAMTAKYEEQVREQQSQLEKEDFSDMVAEHAAKQKNKRKKQTQDSGRAAKKYKEFKF